MQEYFPLTLLSCFSYSLGELNRQYLAIHQVFSPLTLLFSFIAVLTHLVLTYTLLPSYQLYGIALSLLIANLIQQLCLLLFTYKQNIFRKYSVSVKEIVYNKREYFLPVI